MKTFQSILCGISAVILLSTGLTACHKDAASSKINAVSDTGDQDVSSVNLRKGLVAWYPFNGNTLDSSGKGNNVIFNNAIPAKGRNGANGNAYAFDGVSSYMQVANSATLNPGAITLYAMIKPKGFYQGPCHGNYIISKGFNVQAQGRYVLGFDDAAHYNYTQCDQPVASSFENFYGNHGDGVTASGINDLTEYIQLNTWYKVVYTYNGVSSKIYVNGVLKAKVLGNSPFTPNTSDLFIGRFEGSNGGLYPYYFNGLIDEIAIYNRALNAREVAAL